MTSPSNKVVGSVWKGHTVVCSLIVWMTGWNTFVLSVEDYTGSEITYRMYFNDCHEALERLLDYYGLPASSEAWNKLR